MEDWYKFFNIRKLTILPCLSIEIKKIENEGQFYGLNDIYFDYKNQSKNLELAPLTKEESFKNDFFRNIENKKLENKENFIKFLHEVPLFFKHIIDNDNIYEKDEVFIQNHNKFSSSFSLLLLTFDDLSNEDEKKFFKFYNVYKKLVLGSANGLDFLFDSNDYYNLMINDQLYIRI